MDTLPASALLSTPFQRLGAEGWEKGPGQAELMRRWRVGGDRAMAGISHLWSGLCLKMRCLENPGSDGMQEAE